MLAVVALSPSPGQVKGRKVVLPHKELAAAASRVRAGDAPIGEVLRSWRGVRDAGALAISDPLPAVALVRRLVREKLPRRS